MTKEQVTKHLQGLRSKSADPAAWSGACNHVGPLDGHPDDCGRWLYIALSDDADEQTRQRAISHVLRAAERANLS